MTINWDELVAPGYETDYEMLYDLFVVQDKSILWLEDFLGVSHNTIGRRLKALGITKQRGNQKKEKTQS